MKNTLIIGLLSLSASFSFAGTIEVNTAYSRAASQLQEQMPEVTSRILSAVVFVSNGAPPQGALGEFVHKRENNTLAVMSSAVDAQTLSELRGDCDYMITYKNLSFGIELKSIAIIESSCGQQRLQAK